jgi:Flp pilus assembly protein TadD
VELYRQGVILFEEFGELWFGLGQALGELGRWEEAVVEYGRAVGLGFAGSEVRHHLGFALGQLGRWEEAVVQYQLVVEVNPKSAVVRHQLGYGLMRLGRWQEAEVELRKALELHPGSAVVWQQLGDVLRELGEKDEAVEVYRKALEIEPDLVKEKLVTQPRDKVFNSHKSQKSSSNDSRVTHKDRIKSEQSVVVSLYEERLFKSAQSHLVKQEYDQVIDKCSSIIAANPILTDVFPLLGAVYQKNDRLQKAEAFLKTTQHIRNLIATKTVEKIWGPVVRRSPESENDKTFDRQKQNSINKIVIYTCVWRRPELTRIVLSYYSGLKKELSGKIQLELLAVGSEGDASRKLCEDCGFDYFEYANQPLSAKWEYGINRCADYDPDGVIIVGSDDLISQNLIEFYDSQLKNNMVFCGLKDGYFFDVGKENLILWTGYNLQGDPTRVGETIGMGRCFSRFLLDKLGFSIWKGRDINRGLDGAMTQKLFHLGLQVLDYDNCVVAKVDNQEVRIGHCGFEMAEIGAFALDIKFAENLTKFDRYGIRSFVVNQDNPWEFLSRHFPDSLVEELGKLRKTIKA